MNSFRRVRAFQIYCRIGIWKCRFLRRGKAVVSGEKPLRARERTNNKWHRRRDSKPGQALTTAPRLLPTLASN